MLMRRFSDQLGAHHDRTNPQCRHRHRAIVMIATLLIAALGVWSFTRLPIDAVPDITNVQVIVNVEAPGYTPLEAEQRITVPLETAMAGLPRLSYTRSLSRYGLAQVTVVFEDGTDIYFARQLVAERMLAVRGDLPPGPRADAWGRSRPVWARSSCSPSMPNPARRMPMAHEVTPTDLRSVHDWIIRPQLLRVPGVVEVNPIGGYKKEILIAPDPAKLLAYGITHARSAAGDRSEQRQSRCGLHRAQRRAMADARARTGRRTSRTWAASSSGSSTVCRCACAMWRASSVGQELRTGAATQNGREVVMSTVFMLIGENSREVARRVAERLEEIKTSSARGRHRDGRLRPHAPGRTDAGHRREESARRRAARHRRTVRAARQCARGAADRGGHSARDADDHHRHGRRAASRRIS